MESQLQLYQKVICPLSSLWLRYLTFNCLYDYYRLGFINNLLKSKIIKCGNPIDFPDMLEYERLGSQYGICNTDSISIMRNKIWKSFRN